MTGEQREMVDVAAACWELAQRLRADGRFEGATVIVDAPNEAPVLGVEERLESVVESLLANALSFAGTSGTVADLAHVFDRFFTTRRHAKGKGLGLSLLRAVVEAHGGGVRVASEPGRGATFEAVLPQRG